MERCPKQFVVGWFTSSNCVSINMKAFVEKMEIEVI